MLLGVLGWYVLNAMRPMDNPATQDSIGYSYQTGRGGKQDYSKNSASTLTAKIPLLSHKGGLVFSSAVKKFLDYTLDLPQR